ncbi:bZIP transcription factor (Fcr3) [Moelleriella libera RCEF 2490]|uniref:BZIP transcription factor (Fcr3) n=1 Tax=Moelleriella libera RCEF 2490 TaxID=1081109 RepID=A0A167ZZB5_9HYPO|nr:bZIP transcription factor (Fcr3) [Moelleriella libera RCEF 2490]
MDYHAQYQFTNGQPYQAFMPMPPLTPSNSHSVSSDDFNNTSPEAGFDNIQASADAFRGGFEYPAFADASQQPGAGFPSPPMPSNPPQQFAHPQQAHHSIPAVPVEQKPDGKLNVNGHVKGHANGNGNGSVLAPKVDAVFDDLNQARAGSDDDENLTPAQSRRKAQNRAAQRAFRERKEKHVKDLETKIASLEAAQQQASVENEQLRRSLEKMSTENEILRATSAVNQSKASHSPEPATTGPMNYKPTDFYSNVLTNHHDKSLSHRIVTSESGERLLAVAATWDFIINHELYKRGLVDVSVVSERLKTCARCDGQGPVFSEGAILHAMQHSAASGSDDLL